MKFITASEAKRKFLAILDMVAQGEEIIITSRGKPVARIASYDDFETQRVAAREELFKRLESQKPMGIPIDWTRDDLYERDF